MAINIDTLKSLAQTIHDATATGENTAERVGNAFLECANDIAQANTADEVTQALNNLQTSITANANAISSANNNISSLQTSVNTANNNISSLQSSTSSLQTSINTISTAISSLESRCDDLQREIDAGGAGGGSIGGLKVDAILNLTATRKFEKANSIDRIVFDLDYQMFFAEYNDQTETAYYSMWDAHGDYQNCYAYQDIDMQGIGTPKDDVFYECGNFTYVFDLYTQTLKKITEILSHIYQDMHNLIGN